MKRPFFGRTQELKLLSDMQLKRTASLVVISGRRRVGKSRLIQEFGQSVRFLSFEGISPDKDLTASMQRNDFAEQLQKALNIPKPACDSWGDLFWTLANETKEGPVCILLDEINWMGNKDPTFLGKLKTAWDQLFSQNPQIILVLCGSVSGWIKENILKSTGFFGRISLDLVLQPLPLQECRHFWQPHQDLISPTEMLKVLSVTGGIPRYLEEINPRQSAEENIQRLCFQREGLLFSEFNRIFANLFEKRTKSYREIIELLIHGSLPPDAISNRLGYQSGTTTAYIADLELAGFVSRDYTWNINDGRRSKLSTVRLTDNYLRFYLKFIEPQTEQIKQGVATLPKTLSSVFGLQFESLVLSNHLEVIRCLGLTPSDIVAAGPYFQTKTKRTPGCQIDYLVETHFGTLFVCEIKSSSKPIGLSICSEMNEKIKRFKVPRNLSVRPVLIHVNGITDDLQWSDYFTKTINFSDLLGDPHS